MKAITGICAAVLAAFIICSVLPVSGEEAIYTDMVRLHVLAASDDECEQELKLKVRDAILEEVKGITDGVTDSDEAVRLIENELPQLCAAGQRIVEENGFDHVVTAELGKEEYPEREYEGFRLPAGEYKSLRVKIGKAEGRNWWCVLFPPLCTTAAQERDDAFLAAGFTEEQYRVITGGEKTRYKIKFKVIEYLSELIFGEKK